VGRGHSALLQGVIPALTDPAHPRTLGQAHLAGLAALLQGDCCHDLVFSYNLLGDPDVTIPRPAPWRIALPLITDD
jgi:hypothetical protein